VLGDDVAIAVNGATYDGINFRTTLDLNGGVALPDSAYRLRVCGSAIHNTVATPMAADFVRNFSVDHNPPTDPTTVVSTTHTLGVWSKLNVIGMQWSG